MRFNIYLMETISVAGYALNLTYVQSILCHLCTQSELKSIVGCCWKKYSGAFIWIWQLMMMEEMSSLQFAIPTTVDELKQQYLGP